MDYEGGGEEVGGRVSFRRMERKGEGGEGEGIGGTEGKERRRTSDMKGPSLSVS